MEPRGVGEGSMAGGGSWDRGCWPGRFMPMGLWAAAEFRCIWLGWLLLIPVGKEKRGSGTVCTQLGQITELSPFSMPQPGWCQGCRLSPLAYPSCEGRDSRHLGEKPRDPSSGPVTPGHISRHWKDHSSVLGLVSLNDQWELCPRTPHPLMPRALWKHKKASVTTRVTAVHGHSSPSQSLCGLFSPGPPACLRTWPRALRWCRRG